MNYLADIFIYTLEFMTLKYLTVFTHIIHNDETQSYIILYSIIILARNLVNILDRSFCTCPKF